MKIPAIPLLMMTALAVTGCARGSAQDVSAQRQIDQAIARSIDTAANANAAIAEVEVATSAPTRAGPSPSPPPNVVLPAEAVQPVTVDWQGPVEPFLEQMAERAGYVFSSTGSRPANPMMITITANQEPLFGVVRRAGIMVHGYADIAFNPSKRVIEIRYGG